MSILNKDQVKIRKGSAITSSPPRSHTLQHTDIKVKRKLSQIGVNSNMPAHSHSMTPSNVQNIRQRENYELPEYEQSHVPKELLINSVKPANAGYESSMMSYTPQPIFDHRKKVQLVLPNINQKLDTSNARFVSRS